MTKEALDILRKKKVNTRLLEISKNYRMYNMGIAFYSGFALLDLPKGQILTEDEFNLLKKGELGND